MPDYSKVTASQARSAIARTVPETYAEARRYHDGDHWQEGKGWIGTQPMATGETATIVQDLIRKSFLSANKVRDVVRRHVAGVAGRAPSWRFVPDRPPTPRRRRDEEPPPMPMASPVDPARQAVQAGQQAAPAAPPVSLAAPAPSAAPGPAQRVPAPAAPATPEQGPPVDGEADPEALEGQAPEQAEPVDPDAPTPEEQAIIDEAESALTTWWDRVKAPKVVQEAARLVALGGRAVLRLYVPAEEQADGEAGGPVEVPPGPLAEQLARIQLEALAPDRAAVPTDVRSGRTVGIVDVPALSDLFSDADGQGDGLGPVELHYLDGDETILRVIASETEGGAAQETRLPLGGRLLVAAAEAPAIVSRQVLDLQRGYNHSLTMMHRNGDVAGSVERLLLNAMPPGTFKKNATTGELEFSPSPYRTGAGTTNFVQGLPIYDPATGSVQGYTSPSVAWRDPVPVDSFVGTQGAYKVAILEETGQIHALIAGDATASGESRKQARVEFEESLRPTATALEGALRETLEAALRLAAHFAGQPGRFDGLRAEVQATIDPGPISGEERRENREDVTAGLMAEETAMARAGVDDVAAERSKIAREKDQRAARGAAAGLPVMIPGAAITTTTTGPAPEAGQQAARLAFGARAE